MLDGWIRLSKTGQEQSVLVEVPVWLLHEEKEFNIDPRLALLWLLWSVSNLVPSDKQIPFQHIFDIFGIEKMP